MAGRKPCHFLLAEKQPQMETSTNPFARACNHSLTLCNLSIKNMQNDQLIHGYAGLKEKLGFSKWTAIRLMKTGKFPKPIMVSLRRIGWRESVIDAWLDNGGIKQTIGGKTA